MTRPSVVAKVILYVVAATFMMVNPAYSTSTFDPVEECVPCVELFSKLEAGSDGRLSQLVEMKQRGEPKSGTSMMALRAAAMLKKTCRWLSSMYGSETCTITVTGKYVQHLLFTPRLPSANSACSCDTIERVSIILDTESKHTLPVEDSCPWSHPNSIWKGKDVCRAGGGEIHNHEDLLSCVEKAGCDLTDTRLQFAMLRDPRATTVSAYFHDQKRHPQALRGRTIDEYFMDNLAWTCQWVALRYYLFKDVMAENSRVFWYEDATTDVVGWYAQLLDFAGLQLPTTVVDPMMEVAQAASLKSVNDHPGGMSVSADRTWVDEVGVDVVESADAILRAFLPPALLARWGVPFD